MKQCHFMIPFRNNHRNDQLRLFIEGFTFLMRHRGVWESEGSRKYGGESGLGATTKGYQPGGTFYLSPW
jgi:hypothetical protein